MHTLRRRPSDPSAVGGPSVRGGAWPPGRHHAHLLAGPAPDRPLLVTTMDEWVRCARGHIHVVSLVLVNLGHSSTTPACYLCGARATHTCSWCARWVCAPHYTAYGIGTPPVTIRICFPCGERMLVVYTSAPSAERADTLSRFAGTAAGSLPASHLPFPYGGGVSLQEPRKTGFTSAGVGPETLAAVFSPRPSRFLT